MTSCRVNSCLSPPSFPDQTFIPFEPPDEITFRSQLADEFRLECGWYIIPYCMAVARYRNYVVHFNIDLEVEDVESPGTYTNGLTYEQIEELLWAMDAKFADFFHSLPEE